MTFDFDHPIDRRESDSQKWRACHGADVLPMWVADMDFASPPCVVQALRNRVEHGVFGYPLATDELNRAVTAWVQDHYGWPIDAEWIVWLPGLVPSLHAACLAYAAALEEVLTFVPVYPPFLAEHLPMFPVTRVEATYLAWLDTRWLGQHNNAAFFERAGVKLSDGADFLGRGYMRLNFGCPRATLERALGRMHRAVASTADQAGISSAISFHFTPSACRSTARRAIASASISRTSSMFPSIGGTTSSSTGGPSACLAVPGSSRAN